MGCKNHPGKYNFPEEELVCPMIHILKFLRANAKCPPFIPFTLSQHRCKYLFPQTLQCDILMLANLLGEEQYFFNLKNYK
jgi:hypothetical protein